MDFEEVLRRRRMVRHFSDEPVSPGDAQRLVAAALRAPSAGFTQGLHLLVLDDPGDRARLWASTGWSPHDEASARSSQRLQRAPLVLVPMCSRAAYVERYSRPDKASVDDADKWAVPYWYVDAAFASMLILLEAVALGLGALFMGTTPTMPGPFRRDFGVPADFEPVGLVLVGHRHPEVGPNHRADQRRPQAEMVSYGRWGGSPGP